jgi:RNA polymerase sigma-70 factor (ECF subfamily)
MSADERQHRFGSLIYQHFGALYNSARYITRDPADAADLVQDTYLRALRARNRFTHGTNAKAWLVTILINRSRERARRIRLERTHMTRLPDHEDEDPGERLGPGFSRLGTTEEHRLRNIDVRNALHSMPPDLRILLVLKHMEGFTCKEIARILAIPSGTVGSRLVRARSLLSTTLTGYQ